MALNRNLPPVSQQQFAMVPRGDVPRSTFKTQHTIKSTFYQSVLAPVYVDEVLPGDVYKGRVTMFVRMATPLFPVMDNLHLESFFFFVPNRLVWENWVKFCGEQDNPGDSIAYLIPTVSSPTGGFPVASIADYFGLPVVGQVDPASTIEVNALPFRAYNLIYNEWYRPEDFTNKKPVSRGNGPDSWADYANIGQRFKRHDYFTSALPWPVKGGQGVQLPLGQSAPVLGVGVLNTQLNVATPANVIQADGSTLGGNSYTGDLMFFGSQSGTPGSPPTIYADLSQATGAFLNDMRLAVAAQHLLERDARGGTRYTELLRNHFGVMPQDARLQRPEYIGGGHMMLETQAIPQTSAPVAPGDTTVGALGAATTGGGQHEFSLVAPEHGYIIGIVNVRADITYQQGIHRMWSRSTRYDFYWPAFAFLGEQPIYSREIFADGTAGDDDVFGYQERWSDYRYKPSRITGLFRSGVAGSLDAWHLAQEFATRPALNSTFLTDLPPIERVIAAGDLAGNGTFLFDSVWSISCTRALPTRSVPGLTRF